MGIAGCLIIVTWQPQHKGLSATYWRPSTSVADDARRLDYAKSLLGVQTRIPGSNWARSPLCLRVLLQCSTYSCTSASGFPCLRTDLRPKGNGAMEWQTGGKTAFPRPPSLRDSITPFLAVVNAHCAAQQADGSHIDQAEFAHFRRNCVLARVVLE